MSDTLPTVEIKPVRPKALPIKCVVCNGWGTVSNQAVTCHACSGKGYILVPTEEVEGSK